MYYYALGNDFTFSKKVNMFVDFMYSDEQIDRKGIITGMLENKDAALLDGHNALDAEYLSVVTKVNYRFQPKWNAFVKGMYETASVSKTRGDIEKGNYRTSYGYLAGIEYYPLEDSNRISSVLSWDVLTNLLIVPLKKDTTRKDWKSGLYTNYPMF